MGIWAMWLYAAIAPRYGAGPKTAAITGVAWWTIKTLQSAKWAGLGLIPRKAALMPLATTMVAVLAASVLGAWLYDRTDGAGFMIARTWHGVVPAEKADAYHQYLPGDRPSGLPADAGNLGVYILRRTEGDRAHFPLLTVESLDAIRAFTGPDVERAKYYPEDETFLLERSRP
jgi:hypothetical protein